MAYTYTVHRVAEPSVTRWRARTGLAGRGGREMAGVYLDSIGQELVRTRGKPRGAEFVCWLDPPVGVWEFQFRTTWIVFVLKRKGGFLKRLVGLSDVRIILLGLYDHPPSQSELESLTQSYAGTRRRYSA